MVQLRSEQLIDASEFCATCRLCKSVTFQDQVAQKHALLFLQAWLLGLMSRAPLSSA